MALKVFREWERTWRDKAPKAVRCLARDIDKLLVFLECPVQHHRIIPTTNVMAPKVPLFRELKRRVRVMGTFPDMGSCRRMIYALFTYHNGASWRHWTRSSYRIKEIALNQKQAA
jgi:transposase-like protein